MTAQGPTASGLVQRLVSYKEYVVEIVHSIIKDTDMYVCGKHATEDLGVSGLFCPGKGEYPLGLPPFFFSHFFFLHYNCHLL